MSVYVDPSIWPYGRMMMCHMVADSSGELHAMADLIGVARRWVQHAGTWKEHYDIAKSKRALAVKAGAVELDVMEMGHWLIERRKTYVLAAVRAEDRTKVVNGG